MNEQQLREQICATAKSLFDRGLTHGSTGNISARCDDGWLLTPTGSNLSTRTKPACGSIQSIPRTRWVRFERTRASIWA
jgi:ribulose-5-phosphate 4-epimerase/fuculose-1-phosphate aldolase